MTAVLETGPLEAVEATGSANGHDEPAEALVPGPQSGSQPVSIVELAMQDPSFRARVIELLIENMS
ncbi:MAG: hypothetical protein IH956_07510 [Chloroflexi bacterium]|nr:hypothetical protein [Chloroflexota bacterium]